MKVKSFNQPAPQLGNQFSEDRVLRSYLVRKLPEDVYQAVERPLYDMGALAGGSIYQMQLSDRLHEPSLTQWDAWGNRVDQIELTPLWQEAEKIAATHGVVAAAYERRYGQYDRLFQFALAYLFHPSTDVYTCPLAMTDGAARTLLASGHEELIERAVPHLTSRDPAQFWTSGQWMTESTGGSDVGRSETVALLDEEETWRLHGRKWFTSAATGQMALTLARPQGNPPGGKGLALFYIETRDEQGRLQNMEISRLKDKLGTRKVPTAEILLQGTRGVPVAGLKNGVRQIVPMLHITRTWNAVSAAAIMRRGLALARDYAARRVAFGTPLAEKPLHSDTLARQQVEFEAAFHLAFYVVELLGRDEAGEINPTEAALLRLLTSINKLTTGRQAVQVSSEILEAHGGAGYVEDTGLPVLLRDAQVLPIWEGTTNVLALDALRAVQDGQSLPALQSSIERLVTAVADEQLRHAGQIATDAVAHAASWWERTAAADQSSREIGARRFALTLGRSLQLALLVSQGQWSLTNEADGRARLSALLFAQTPIDLITADYSARELDALANERALSPDAERRTT